MITQETIHALKCLCKGNLSSSSEISVLPSVFLQSKEYCFFWFFWHLFQEETEMFVFPWHMKKGITLGYLLFSYVEPAASWLHLSHNRTNTHTLTQPIILAENPLTEILYWRKTKKFEWVCKGRGKGNTDPVLAGKCSLVQTKELSLPPQGSPPDPRVSSSHEPLYFLISQRILGQPNQRWPSVCWHMDLKWTKTSSADLNKPFSSYLETSAVFTCWFGAWWIQTYSEMCLVLLTEISF